MYDDDMCPCFYCTSNSAAVTQEALNTIMM
jgi:hypothetical protein